MSTPTTTAPTAVTCTCISACWCCSFTIGGLCLQVFRRCVVVHAGSKTEVEHTRVFVYVWCPDTEYCCTRISKYLLVYISYELMYPMLQVDAPGGDTSMTFRGEKEALRAFTAVIRGVFWETCPGASAPRPSTHKTEQQRYEHIRRYRY